LEEVIDDFDLDVDLDDLKGIRKKRDAVIEALEEENGKEGNADGYEEDAVKKMSSDELEESVEKHDLDVDLTGKVRADRKKVIEALEDEDLLD
jgi:hypothetical protein